jgi:hypothetical protein
MADDKRKQTNDDSPRAQDSARDRKENPRSAADLRQRDIASDIQGRNKLQGNDQESVRNQRREQPRVGGASGRPSGSGKSDE